MEARDRGTYRQQVLDRVSTWAGSILHCTRLAFPFSNLNCLHEHFDGDHAPPLKSRCPICAIKDPQTSPRFCFCFYTIPIPYHTIPYLLLTTVSGINFVLTFCSEGLNRHRFASGILAVRLLARLTRGILDLLRCTVGQASSQNTPQTRC